MYDQEIKLITVLSKMNRSLNDRLGQNLKSHGITTTDYVILTVLRDYGEIPMQKIGELVFITSGTITYATNRLIKQGMISKRQDSDDRRKFFIKLSVVGENRLKDVNEKHEPYLADLLSDFSSDDLVGFTEMAKRIGKSVESKM